ncbi:PaaI family thioesterase [Methanoplanus sp. FWC-SCC4]|uniref:PaaI family thioesterase n=1 Tax=Methanochimaera problematica TaxID=2609417 RepID=A0AA97FAG1_9EURY|nr:PaaI family thioesterase [Methanoplanus sp. FWC-SCC4]WOF15369.1 PaaI family thioesterase [Methanoplanus sp. FWC-SCC4]
MSYPDEVLKKGRLANPYFCLMGIDPISFGDGGCVLLMDVRADMLNGAGWLQGGIYVSLADEAMALAISTILNAGEGIATISETTSFLRGVNTGKICAKASVVRRGRKIIFAEGIVFQKDDESKVLSKTTASFAVVKR